MFSNRVLIIGIAQNDTFDAADLKMSRIFQYDFFLKSDKYYNGDHFLLDVNSKYVHLFLELLWCILCNGPFEPMDDGKATRFVNYERFYGLKFVMDYSTWENCFKASVIKLSKRLLKKRQRSENSVELMIYSFVSKTSKIPEGVQISSYYFEVTQNL